jgi:hypothetical protein
MQSGPYLTFSVTEFYDGRDLDGDGDLNDFALHAWNARTGEFVKTERFDARSSWMIPSSSKSPSRLRSTPSPEAHPRARVESVRLR